MVQSRLPATFYMPSLVLVALAGFGGTWPAGAKKTGGIPYSQVAPLIKSQCASCHNAKRHPEAVDLSSYQALMKSGEHGPIVIAGHPEKSNLIKYVDGEKQPRMPFQKAPLSEANIRLLKQWIAAGARD